VTYQCGESTFSNVPFASFNTSLLSYKQKYLFFARDIVTFLVTSQYVLVAETLRRE
jgi:hypothetical protein